MEENSEKIKNNESDLIDAATITNEDLFLSWEAPDFEYNPKGVSWYWLSLIFSIVLVTLAIWQRNFLFAIFVVIAWFAVMSFANRYPSYWKFKLNEKGIGIHPVDSDERKKFYSFTEIDGFDIHKSSDEHKELVIKIKSRFTPFLRINFPHTHEEKIIMVISKFVPKEEYEDSLADHLFKIVRF